MRGTVLEKKPIYIVCQVCRNFATIALDADDLDYKNIICTASLIMQTVKNDLLNSFDRVIVKSYQVGKTHGTVRFILIHGWVSIKSFLHQGTLRSPVQAKDFHVEAGEGPFYILAMASYVKINPEETAITGDGFKGQERIYDDRIRLWRVLELGAVVEAEVIRLEAGKLEFELVFQDRELRYYLPNCFKDTEAGGHKLGIHLCFPSLPSSQQCPEARHTKENTKNVYVKIPKEQHSVEEERDEH
ncbi:unnamed protein product [Enterobius vermicularis]|uniref:DUF223 domain-containing protein n=1 Tax=Enterobius vermicularis TaxID=51028 RepID=A0A0N4VH49_ENTVE|nr:unnamed protein product [Enterobius vermicularis]